MDMESVYIGRCACGEIHYECSAEPLAAYNCHCLSCQQACGAPFATICVFSKEAVKITGVVAEYASDLKGTTDHFRTNFCRTCGTPLFAHSDVKPDVIIVRATTLPDNAWRKPIADIWTITLRPDIGLDTHIPKVYRSPPLLGGETYI